MSVLRILIVDDAAEVRRDLKTILALSADLEIIGEAEDGVEAIRLMESLKPDVILMDLEMPNMDGYQATQQVKALRPDCKVVVLSVHDYEEARTAAQKSGVDAFLVKGAPVETIVQTIFSIRSKS